VIVGFIVALILVGFWDGFTTFFGTNQILSGGIENLTIAIISFFFAIIITSFLFCTKFILNEKSDDFFPGLLRFLLLVSIGYDLYTSYIGNQEFILGGNVNSQQFFVLIGMTILVSGSPIICSYLLDKVIND